MDVLVAFQQEGMVISKLSIYMLQTTLPLSAPLALAGLASILLLLDEYGTFVSQNANEEYICTYFSFTLWTLINACP